MDLSAEQQVDVLHSLPGEYLALIRSSQLYEHEGMTAK